MDAIFNRQHILFGCPHYFTDVAYVYLYLETNIQMKKLIPDKLDKNSPSGEKSCQDIPASTPHANHMILDLVTWYQISWKIWDILLITKQTKQEGPITTRYKTTKLKFSHTDLKADHVDVPTSQPLPAG